MGVIEVERKRALNDAAPLTARLIAANYRQVGTTTETDTYYSRPDIDFLTTVECLRVRQRDDFAEITYKPASTPDSHSATGLIAKPETNVVLAGPTYAVAANALLDMLGMVLLCRVEKTRAMFQHPGHAEVTVVIDHLAGIGAFAETEVMAPDPAAAATLLGEVEQQLGLTSSPVVNLPYRDLVLQHDRARADCPRRPTDGPVPARERA